MGNKEKNATLGMPSGTACNRLRKLVLFRQLQKHKENICVRCNKEIEKVEDLSIEHIKPWEGISAELFWNLDNVAFSHLSCNRPFRCGPVRKEIHGTYGSRHGHRCRCEPCCQAMRDYKKDYRERTGVH